MMGAMMTEQQNKGGGPTLVQAAEYDREALEIHRARHDLGLSQEELADRFGLTLSAVKRRIRRAYKLLGII